jgi:D-3-phosphoglycerate dehydrogenase
MSAAVHHVVVIGDEFTPPDLLRRAIERHPRFETGLATFATADLTGADFHQHERAGISEFLGDPQVIARLVDRATVLVTTFAPINAEVLSAAPELRLIACGRGGPVNIDVGAATKLGVAVTNCPGRNSEAVAEFVLGVMLSLARQLPTAERYVLECRWVNAREDSFEKPTGPELAGKTLGVIGFGRVGRRLCELVAPLGMRVLAHDPYVEVADMKAVGAIPAELEYLLEESHVVTIHARPSASREPLLGRAELARMRSGAYLINTSRGSNLDEEALVGALADGQLAGAALDVFDTEPLPSEHPLRTHDNVILTPHSAGVSHDVPRHTVEMVADAVNAWLHGERPAHLVNPRALEASSAGEGAPAAG